MPSTKTISIVFLIVVALLSACSSETPSPEVIAVTSVEIHNPGPSTLVVGSKLDLSAEVIPENATDRTVTWKSSNESVATVDASGLVQAVGAGDVTITASAGNCEDSVVIKVVNNEIPAESVTLSETSIELLTGSSTEITATVLPEDSTSSVVWESSDSAIASVRDGVITAHKPGEATITAYAGDKSASCTVSVDEKKVPATGIKLDTSTLRLALEGTYQLKAIFEPANAEVSEIIWTSSNEEIAVVDESGFVTAKSVGETEITAASGNLKASCLVTVAESITRVTVSLPSNELSLNLGESQQLTAETDPADAEVVWSSNNESVATVDQNGNVTAKSVGKATVTVTATEGGAKASCIVTVNEIPVTSISINGNIPENLQIGDTITLTAAIEPDNATNPAVRWVSSDTSVARVDGGNVSIVGSGTATITATAVSNDEAAASVTIVVKEIAVESITLDKTILDLTEGEWMRLTAAVLPENATNKTVIWESSDEKVATVVNGIVTAVSTGEETITAKAGERTASCTVTVSQKTVPVESISLNRTSLTLEVGKSETLTASVSPENATDKTVTWESSNTSVATVEDGVVMAAAPGKATITAKAGDKTASCTVTVNASSIGSIVEPDPIDPNNYDTMISFLDADSTVQDILSNAEDAVNMACYNLSSQVNDLAYERMISNSGAKYDKTKVEIIGDSAVLTADKDIQLTGINYPEYLADETVTINSGTTVKVSLKDDNSESFTESVNGTVKFLGQEYEVKTDENGNFEIVSPSEVQISTDELRQIVTSLSTVWCTDVFSTIIVQQSPYKFDNVELDVSSMNMSNTNILFSSVNFSIPETEYSPARIISSEGFRYSASSSGYNNKQQLCGPLTFTEDGKTYEVYFDLTQTDNGENGSYEGYIYYDGILYDMTMSGEDY